MHDLASGTWTVERAIQEELATARWVKSSYSGPTGGNCVEVASLGDGLVAVQDSRRASGPALVFPAREWGTFISQAKAGGSDPGRVGRAHHRSRRG